MQNLKKDDVILLNGTLKSIRERCNRVVEILTERGYVTFLDEPICIEDIREVINSRDWTSTQEMFDYCGFKVKA